MKTAASVVGLLVSGLFLMGTAVGCGHRHVSPEQRADHIVEKIKDKLDLNEEQTSKLVIAKNEILKVRQEMKAQRTQTRTDFFEMLEQPKLDQDRILSLVKEKTRTVNEKAPEVVVALAGFFDSLTPEQQKTLREKIKDKMEHRRHSRKYN
ncbi:MAG: hypothetical protein G3M70_08715 [Candidatus Nitronauta litoralis]|uniref:Periplasmic heavy metal sensor n=1 Tax=Candidatus Nitronauta litoralis TaxID=2705533 RepID=A0A7T0G062_9BACT|nr:MAG: hypothetical protein G3M70_08715 [Candidatus Nitronauta litoralis]